MKLQENFDIFKIYDDVSPQKGTIVEQVKIQRERIEKAKNKAKLAKIKKMNVINFFFQNDKMIFTLSRQLKNGKCQSTEIDEEEAMQKGYSEKVNEYMLRFIKKMLQE
jgi:hypothetical protein